MTKGGGHGGAVRLPEDEYALTMPMVEDGKAEIVERHTIDAREHLRCGRSAAIRSRSGSRSSAEN